MTKADVTLKHLSGSPQHADKKCSQDYDRWSSQQEHCGCTAVEANLDELKEDKPAAGHQRSSRVWESGQGRRIEVWHIKAKQHPNNSLPQKIKSLRHSVL